MATILQNLPVGQKVGIARRQTVTPTVSLPFFDLFADPKGAPASFELRAEGVESP